MNPQRQYEDDQGIEPDIRPKLGVVQGGGESTGRSRGHLSAAPSQTGGESSDNAASTGSRLKALEGGGETSDPKRGHLSSVKDEEESAPGHSSLSADEEMLREKLGMGYTGEGSKKSNKLSKLYSSNSALKKKIAMAGAVAGGSLIVSVIVFLALLPLKIEQVISNLETQFGATAADAVDEQMNNLFSAWVAKEIMPNLNKGSCHSTIDATCVSTADGDSPVTKLMNGWKDGRLEQKLARMENGIVIGKRGDRFYIASSGGARAAYIPEAQLADLQSGRISLFEADLQTEDGTKVGDRGSSISRTELRQTVRNALKNGTLYQKTILRYKVNDLIARKYGIKHCLVACDTRDKANDWYGNKKLAAKGFLYQRLAPEKYSLIMSCLLDPSECADSKDGDLENANPGETERETTFQKNLRAQLLEYRNKFGQDKLAELIDRAEEIDKSNGGLFDYVAKNAVESIVKKVGGTAVTDAAAKSAAEYATKAIPIVGWVVFISGIVAFATEIGPALQHAGYALNSATAAEMYGTYSTAIAECKSGHCDLEVLGSFSGVLSTNLSGSSEDQVDMTASKLYQTLNQTGGSTNAASILGSILPGTVSAEEKTYVATGCPVPAGKLVCDDERLNRGNEGATATSDFVNTYLGGLTQPFVALHGAVKGISGVVSDVVNNTPVLKQAVDALSGAVAYVLQDVIEWVTKEAIANPFTPNMNGARTYDMAAAGADVVMNKHCQVDIGCVENPTVAAQVRTQYLEDQKAEFKSRPLFARMFDTDTSYSFVSQLALSMPGSASGATAAGVGTMFTSPVSKLSGVFSGAFSRPTAYAAVTSADDPFGVPQNVFPKDQIPKDPNFWNNNCVNGPLAKSTPGSLDIDISEWLNDPANVAQDPDTGDAVNLKTNGCLLLKTTIQGGGAFFGIKQDGASTTPASGGTVVAGFPLKTTKAAMQEKNGSCITAGPEMCKGGHPYAAYDVMAEPGTEVVSLFDGKVVGVLQDKCPGRMVSIYSEAQGVTVSYLHMNLTEAPQMAISQVVKAGDVIGRVGPPAAGCGTPHLHIDAAARNTRPGCARENCPAANQAIFTAGDQKIGLGKALYENFLKLP